MATARQRLVPAPHSLQVGCRAGGGHSLAPEAPLACRQQQLDLPPLSLLFPTLNKPTNVLPSRGSWAGVA